MKKIFFVAALMFCAIASQAQFFNLNNNDTEPFGQGTKYVNASLTGLGISYNSTEKLRFGIDATAGYFLWDDMMIKGTVGFDHKAHADNITLGLGGRYYFDQNGIFLGTGLEYLHEAKNYNDLRIPIEAGYCFYVSHYVSIEPVVYYKMSINDFSYKSTVGLKVGIGLYF